MYRRFGAALHEFGSAADIADHRVLDSVHELLEEYLVGELGVDFYEILVERWVKQSDGPQRVLDTLRVHGGERFPNVPVGDGSTSQTAYSFVKDRPLWITAADKGLLRKRAMKYINSWGTEPEPIDKLPQYKSGNGYPIKTSIIQPLKRSGEAFGLINVESKDHLVCNPWAKGELEHIARGVASIVAQAESQKVTREGTEQSIKELRQFVSTSRWNVLRKPKLFFACSEDAATDVTRAVKEIAGGLEDHDLILWQDREEDGEARELMLKALRESRLIVCYLSEPVEGNYVDNPNVLFEAGIAEGLVHAWSDVQLIPVRERGSEIPWDIGGLNVLQVPRDSEGKLKEPDFKKRLRKRLT